jgi:thiol-disulfide isomerase/thioredoxin
VKIDVPYATGVVPYTFQFYRFKGRLREFVLYYRDAGREGEITSDGKPYKVAVLDENADGRFDDLSDGTLIIDLNRDGTLVGESDSAEHHKLNEPFSIHGKVWQVASLSPDGTSIGLRPSDAQVEMKAYLDVGYPAPPFTAKDLDGNPVVLAEEAANAKYVLLDFWASWCGPCRAEFPYLRRLQARYKNHGLRIIGINLDSERDKAVQAATESQLDYRHVFDGGGWKNAVAVQYRVHGIPETYLLDRDLKILEKALRGSHLEVRLAELLGPGDATAAEPAELLGPRVVDQSNLPAWQGCWTNVVPENRIGQTFQPGLPVLTGVGLDLMAANRGRSSDTLTVEIALGSQSLAMVSKLVPAGYSGIVCFDLPTNLVVAPGTTYTLWVHDTGKVAFGWKYDSDTYSGGTRLFGGKADSGDFFFRTYGMASTAPAGK